MTSERAAKAVKARDAVTDAIFHWHAAHIGTAASLAWEGIEDALDAYAAALSHDDDCPQCGGSGEEEFR